MTTLKSILKVSKYDDIHRFQNIFHQFELSNLKRTADDYFNEVLKIENRNNNPIFNLAIK